MSTSSSNCENCSSQHNGTYGSGRFCSNKCSRGYSTKAKRREINDKVSKTLTGKPTGRPMSSDVYSKITLGHFDHYNSIPFDQLGLRGRRRRILNEQTHKCNKCGNSEWLGFELTLEVDHIDGNPKNNSRNNLEALCPNCHSLTPTWRGRKAKRTRTTWTDDALATALEKHDYKLSHTFDELGLARKGSTYERAKIILSEILKSK